MKKKFLMVLGISLFSLIIISTVYAFTMGSIDAIWGLIDTDGAQGDTWASGPLASSTDYDNPQHTDGDAADHETVQNLVAFDWNQVRYGDPDTFGNKSGFGFLGRSTVGDAPAENVPFLVGQFCHFNNPINSDNSFEYVPLNIQIKNIGCEEPFVLQGSGDLSFQYIFNLDETTNRPGVCFNYGVGDCLCDNPNSSFFYYNRCEYGPGDTNWPSDGGSYCYSNYDPYVGDPSTSDGLNYDGCADSVSITKSTVDQTFICLDDRDTEDTSDDITKTYYLSLLGFMEKPTTGCPANPTGYTLSNNLVYTAEYEDNCYCVYAAVTGSQLTPVIIRDLAAVGVEDGIHISWRTVSEVNNLGFNIMRAEKVDGEQVQVNPELIMSAVAPGDMFGSAYEYLDETALAGVTYYYWLVDVPLESIDQPGIHGPVSAVR